jgi:hypothetical protein
MIFTDKKPLPLGRGSSPIKKRLDIKNYSNISLYNIRECVIKNMNDNELKEYINFLIEHNTNRGDTYDNI